VTGKDKTGEPTASRSRLLHDAVNVEWKDEMTWTVFGTKRSWPIRGSIAGHLVGGTEENREKNSSFL
jgi:hypothetical protein